MGSSVIQTIEQLFQVLDYMYRDDLKFVEGRATENRFFAGSDRFLVCKTDSVCIKRIFFSVRKNALCGS